MATAEEKRIKSEFKAKAQKEPGKHYPIEALKENGFQRFKCEKCGSFFWSAIPRTICGDPNCSGKYQFIGNSPTKTKLEYLEVWERFSKTFKKFGYAPIARYPVAARWRDDMDFVIASIADFQPYVVSGEIEPPANPLTIPQFCLRFGDVDNVGITGRHYTGFVMIGQHAFMPPKDYKPKDYLSHIFKWLTEEVKIPKNELQFHEDTWAGGGNMGPSIEFFSRGLELGNQVYMQYDIRNGIKELDIKVLDMGMGQERYAWLTNGTNTSYEVVLPSVVKKIFSLNGIKPDAFVWNKFLPYSGMLNLDEADNIEKIWQNIARDIDMGVKELKEKIIPVSAIYSIADHTRSLLLALNDSALPSNVGGGYNLRVILRRSLDFISKYCWDIHLPDLCREHAKYLKPQYPELMENLDDIDEILDFEKKKYSETVVKSKKLVSSLSLPLTEENLIELYDSHGISPDLVAEQLKIKVPEGFYGKVAERHEKAEEIKIEKHKTDVSGINETKKLYYEDESLCEFSAKVLKVDGEKVILDQTAFYPRGGGAEPDHGTINGFRVYDIEKIGNVILHHVERHNFRVGETVKGKIDKERKETIKIHHTAVHVINLAAREILGNHIWQAGSYKDAEKARLDITHYETPSDEVLGKIENLANKIVKDNVKVKKEILQRDVAEQKYGFRLYQGGAVPGKMLRIVSVGDDHEACGGIHVDKTGELGLIKILKVEKIQDGVVRIEIAAGNAVEKHYRKYADEKLKQMKSRFEKYGIQLPRNLETNIKSFLNARKFGNITEEIEKLEKTVFEKEKEERKKVERAAKETAKTLSERLKFEVIANKRVLVAEVSGGQKELQEISRKLSADDTVIVLFSAGKMDETSKSPYERGLAKLGEKEKITFFASVGAKTDVNIVEIVNRLITGPGSTVTKGPITWGGSKYLAQGFFAEKKENLKNIIERTKQLMQ